MSELRHNPFAWDQSVGDRVNSPVVGLQLKTTDQQEIKCKQINNAVNRVKIKTAVEFTKLASVQQGSGFLTAQRK